MPTHRRAMSCTVLEELSGSKHGHSAACLLQLYFRLQCRPAPCGRGIHRLMGPTSSRPLQVSIQVLNITGDLLQSCSPDYNQQYPEMKRSASKDSRTNSVSNTPRFILISFQLASVLPSYDNPTKHSWSAYLSLSNVQDPSFHLIGFT